MFLLKDMKLDNVNLSNTRACKVVKNLTNLVEVCTAEYDVEYQNKWTTVCLQFLTVTEWLDSKIIFTFEEACNFQKDADSFCSTYFNITGRDGMTNYLHCLQAGHFAEFLIKYKNTYRYSQQGWENINSVMKSSYHHNT